MSLKKVRRIMWGIFGAMAAALLIAALTNSFLFVALGTVLLFVFIGFNYAKWRCPHCGEYLGRNVKKYCTCCGHKLDGLE